MRILRALVLVSALSVCAYADGNMDNGITTPPSAPATASSTTDSTGSKAVKAQATKSVTTETVGIALSVMQGVLSVL